MVDCSCTIPCIKRLITVSELNTVCRIDFICSQSSHLFEMLVVSLAIKKEIFTGLFLIRRKLHRSGIKLLHGIIKR